MTLTKSRLKQLIRETLNKINEEDEPGDEPWTGRAEEEAEELRLQAAEDAQRQREREEHEAEYAKLVVIFKEVLDGVFGENDYDLLDELESIANYAMEHRERWEAAAPAREIAVSDFKKRIAASQAERGFKGRGRQP